MGLGGGLTRGLGVKGVWGKRASICSSAVQNRRSATESTAPPNRIDAHQVEMWVAVVSVICRVSSVMTPSTPTPPQIPRASSLPLRLLWMLPLPSTQVTLTSQSHCVLGVGWGGVGALQREG